MSFNRFIQVMHVKLLTTYLLTGDQFTAKNSLQTTLRSKLSDYQPECRFSLTLGMGCLDKLLCICARAVLLEIYFSATTLS